MENASKALIIAGAILLAIVIISLGLVVVNNTRSVTDNANLNAQEIETFNNKFVAYEGTNITGARVKSLIQTAIASNQANDDKQVQVVYHLDKKTTTNGTTYSYESTKNNNVFTPSSPESFNASKLLSSKTYTVKISYTKGLVSQFEITEN